MGWRCYLRNSSGTALGVVGLAGEITFNNEGEEI
jgi:hypothetical protein